MGGQFKKLLKLLDFGSFCSVLSKNNVGHEVSHGFRRLILHLAGGVGVGAEGEPGVVVAQHTGDLLDVHAVLQGQGSERMPLRHNKDKSESLCGATG